MARKKSIKSSETEIHNEEQDTTEEEIPKDQLEQDCSQKDKEIELLQSKIAEMQEQYLRKQADMDNYRKRIIREREDGIAYANKQLLEDLTTVLDNFERAIQSAEKARNFDAFHDGILLIEKQFLEMIERKWHLKRFEPLGEEFDPQKHEAIMLEEDSKSEKQIILEVFQPGYMIREMVLRTAKVKVSQPISPLQNESPDETQETENT